jgi:VanZ family protein
MFSKYQTFLLITLFVYLTFLAWLSLAPASYFSHSLIHFREADKLVHGIIYLVLGFLLYLLLNDVWKKSRVKTTIIVFLTTSTYGLLMEFLQLQIKSLSRSFEIGDLLANCVGAVAGILLGYFVLQYLSKPNNKNQPR